MIAAIAVAGCGAGGHRPARMNPHAAVSSQTVGDSPFGVAVTPDDRDAFVDLLGGRVLVYSLAHRTPRLVRSLTVRGETLGCSVTRDGRFLLVADGQGAAVLSVARAERGEPHPLLGELSPPRGAHVSANGAIETASSADGRFVFVSLEYGNPHGAIAVYHLGAGATPRISGADFVGTIPLGQAVVGSALSPDGRYLYVTSEIGGPRHGVGGDGTLSVLDVGAAERGSAHAVLASVAAGHEPVRVAVSPDGATVWVTARADNRLLAFSARRLTTQPSRALRAEVRVGTAPVGVGLFDRGTRVIVADSNRFDAHGAHSALTIVDAHSAHAPSIIATLRAGSFPREIAIDPHDDTALVTDFGSDQLETVALGRVR